MVLSSVDAITSAFGSYPTQFFDDMLKYGDDFARDVLELHQYHLFDPMVSDRSCQLRVIWIACFALEKRCRSQMSDDDLIVFGLSRFLTETAFFADHEIIGHVPFRSNVKLWPNELSSLDSARQRNLFFGLAKQIVQVRVLQDLCRWMSDVPPGLVHVNGLYPVPSELAKQELVVLFSQLPEFSFSEIPIPLFHFFPGLVVLATLAAAFDIVVAVLLRKAESISRGEWGCSAQKIFYFKYNAQTKQFEVFSPTECDAARPVVVFSSHCCGIDSVNASDDFVESLNNLFNVNASIFDYIYASASTHAMLTGNDFVNENVDIEGSPSLTQLTRQYLQLARKTGLVVRDTGPQVGMLSMKKLDHITVLDTPFEITHVLCAALGSEV
ncbi:MAG: hypothetical protein LBR89_00835 [Holosporales bacterium]|jgi:hypothetical protein|nr:hypothetical protein [Holosporales bacterium]